MDSGTEPCGTPDLTQCLVQLCSINHHSLLTVMKEVCDPAVHVSLDAVVAGFVD